MMSGGTVVMATSWEVENVAMAQGAKTAWFTRAVLAFLQPQLVGKNNSSVLRIIRVQSPWPRNRSAGAARSISTCGTTSSGS